MIRTCIVTKKKFEKKKLVRFTEKNGKIVIDKNWNLGGRGASMLPNLNLLEIALKKGLIEKALKVKRKMNDIEKERLFKEFKSLIQNNKKGPIV